MLKTVCLAVLLAVSVAHTAPAADDHGHKGKYGGVVADTSGHHHVELVAEGTSLTLYVLHSDGELQDVTGAKGTATTLSGGKTEKINLVPDGDTLKGEGGTSLQAGDTIVVTLTMPRHKPEQARFTLK